MGWITEQMENIMLPAIIAGRHGNGLETVN